MRSQGPNQEQPVEEQTDQTLMQKFEALQKRVRIMGIALDGSDDKAFMDKA